MELREGRRKQRTKGVKKGAAGGHKEAGREDSRTGTDEASGGMQGRAGQGTVWQVRGLHEMCAVWGPVWPILGPQFQGLVPEL